jgi:large subunit ribosomal protein L25
MEAVKIDAKKREVTGKKVRRYRREGQIPSIMYGQGNNINLLIDGHTFLKTVGGLTKSTLINLNVEGKEYDVLIKDYDYDHIKEQFTHLDFFELKKGSTLHTTIQVEFTGNAIGLREGGVIEKHLTNVEIECLPKDIIPYIELDITGMNIGDTMYVRDLDFDEKKYRIISHEDEVIVHVAGKMSEVEVETEETDETGIDQTVTAEAPAEESTEE